MKLRRIILPLMILLLYGCAATQSVGGQWKSRGEPKPDLWCHDYVDVSYMPKPLLYPYSKGQLAGRIVMGNGTEIDALYRLEGTTERWDWGADGTGYRYSIVVKPDGTGLYYDFSLADENGRSKAGDVYECKLIR